MPDELQFQYVDHFVSMLHVNKDDESADALHDFIQLYESIEGREELLSTMHEAQSILDNEQLEELKASTGVELGEDELRQIVESIQSYL